MIKLRNLLQALLVERAQTQSSATLKADTFLSHALRCNATHHRKQEEKSCNFEIQRITVRAVAANPNFNVRLSDQQLADLRRIADYNGVEVSQLIRWAIDALIKEAAQNGGRILLPFTFGENYEAYRRVSDQLRAAEEPPPPKKRKQA